MSAPQGDAAVAIRYFAATVRRAGSFLDL